MKDILISILSYFGHQGSLVEWLTAIGTVSSSFIAIYFGAIRPIRRQAKFKFHPIMKSTFFAYSHYSNIGKEGDMVELGFFVEQISGALSNHINILAKRIWYWEENDLTKNQWNHFIPSNLEWAAKDTSFSVGVQRYCHLGTYGDPPGNDFVGCIFDLSITENRGDPLFSNFSSMLPAGKKIEIELIISGENVQAKEFKIQLSLNDPRTLGPIGKDGLPVGGKLIDAIESKIVI